MGGEEIDDKVPGDPRKPAPKRAPIRVDVVPLDRQGHGAEDVLNDVLGVSLLQPLSTRKPVHQRSVQFGEVGPRLLIGPVAKSYQQALACARRSLHQVFRPLSTRAERRFDCHRTRLSHQPKRRLTCRLK